MRVSRVNAVLQCHHRLRGMVECGFDASNMRVGSTRSTSLLHRLFLLRFLRVLCVNALLLSHHRPRICTAETQYPRAVCRHFFTGPSEAGRAMIGVSIPETVGRTRWPVTPKRNIWPSPSRHRIAEGIDSIYQQRIFQNG